MGPMRLEPWASSQNMSEKPWGRRFVRLHFVLGLGHVVVGFLDTINGLSFSKHKCPLGPFITEPP